MAGYLVYLVVQVYLLGRLSYFPSPSALNDGCMTGAELVWDWSRNWRSQGHGV